LWLCCCIPGLLLACHAIFAAACQAVHAMFGWCRVAFETLQLQLQLQCLARQSRATRKGARGSWGNRNKTITRQNMIKKLKNIIIYTTFAAIDELVSTLVISINRITKHNFIGRIVLCTLLGEDALDSCIQAVA
jgi:hypothetical protein